MVAGVVVAGAVFLLLEDARQAVIFLHFHAVRQASVACCIGHLVGSASPHCYCNAAIWLSCSVSRCSVEGSRW